MGLAFHPILNVQSWNTAKMFRVMCCDSQAMHHRNRGNLHIMPTNQHTRSFQPRANMPIAVGGGIVKGQADKTAEKQVLSGPRTPRRPAVDRAGVHFAFGDGADGNIGIRYALHALTHLRLSPIDVVSANIGIQQIPHSISSGASLRNDSSNSMGSSARLPYVSSINCSQGMCR